MRFLFVNNIFPLFAKADSGASVRSMRIIDALTQIGHVDVISFLNDEKSNIDNSLSKGATNKLRKIFSPS